MINKYFDSCTLLILKSFEKVTDFEYKLMFEKMLETVLFGQKLAESSLSESAGSVKIAGFLKNVWSHDSCCTRYILSSFEIGSVDRLNKSIDIS